VGDRASGFAVKPTAGDQAGRILKVSPAQYCEALQRSAVRFKAMTGQPMRALFRAPGGRTSAALLQTARACGWHHVPWSPAGFLGDELSSQRYPNAALLKRALQEIRPGDILLAHLGIWSRQDPWAPAVLEPLITGLKARGLCFATLRDHPSYRSVGLAPEPTR
jgi:peptidoglycan/xylan/chitin deacetylase (PgdA/CDA1 family)